MNLYGYLIFPGASLAGEPYAKAALDLCVDGLPHYLGALEANARIWPQPDQMSVFVVVSTPLGEKETDQNVARCLSFDLLWGKKLPDSHPALRAYNGKVVQQ